MTTIRVETDRMMPRSIKKERILWARRVSSATPIGSRNNSRRFMRAFPLSLLRADREKGFPPRRLASAWRGTALKRYTFHSLLRNVTRDKIAPNSLLWERLGAV